MSKGNKLKILAGLVAYITGIIGTLDSLEGEKLQLAIWFVVMITGLVWTMACIETIERKAL